MLQFSKFWASFGALLFFFVLSIVSANTDNKSNEQIIDSKLWKHKEWIRLMHAKKSIFGNEYSKALGKVFF